MGADLTYIVNVMSLSLCRLTVCPCKLRDDGREEDLADRCLLWLWYDFVVAVDMKREKA